MHTKGCSHVTLRSVLIPGGFSVVMIASVDTTSTRVAVRPPCSVFPALRCSSDISISQVHLPSPADNTLTWRRQCFILYQWHTELVYLGKAAAALPWEIENWVYYYSNTSRDVVKTLAGIRSPCLNSFQFVMAQHMMRFKLDSSLYLVFVAHLFQSRVKAFSSSEVSKQISHRLKRSHN